MGDAYRAYNAGYYYQDREKEAFIINIGHYSRRRHCFLVTLFVGAVIYWRHHLVCCACGICTLAFRG